MLEVHEECEEHELRPKLNGYIGVALVYTGTGCVLKQLQACCTGRSELYAPPVLVAVPPPRKAALLLGATR